MSRDKNHSYVIRFKESEKKTIEFSSDSIRHQRNYSKTSLKRTCSKADTWLKRTKDFVSKYQFKGQSLINLTYLKRTPV